MDAKEALAKLHLDVQIMQEKDTLRDDRDSKQSEVILELSKNVSSLAESCKRLNMMVMGDSELKIAGVYHDVAEHKKIVESFKTIKWFMFSVVFGVFGIAGAIMYAVFAIMDHLKM